MEADFLMELLNLRPLPMEGGYFVETYRSTETVSAALRKDQDRSISTAIYYLLTPESFSALHKLPTDEIYHFYLGDPVEMLELDQDGSGRISILGRDIESGMKVQHCVRAGTWQGSRLVSGGKWALLGTTMAPSFEFEDYLAGHRDHLLGEYPGFEELIIGLTRSS
jgi:hypothetical protein